MGRVARAIANAALAHPNIDVTFLHRGTRDDHALRGVFDGRDIAIAHAVSARAPGRYDVVWFPWNGMHFGARAPAVVSIHDAFAFTQPARGVVARRREQAPIRRAAHQARRIVTPSFWSRAEIVRTLRVDPESVVVIPNPRDPFFHPGPPEQARSYVLMVGVGEGRKNARVVIEACSQAFSAPSDMLVIVGRPSNEDAARLRQLRLRHTVLTDVEDDALRSLYRGARVVTVPSTAEGFGLVPVEAMACGTPVLVSSGGALPESTEGAAPLLDPLDVAAWRDAIARVLRDDGFAAMLAARGAQRFADRDPAASLHSYLDLFFLTAEGAARSA